MITGKAKLAFVIGNPIEHSISPQLHNFLLKTHNINGAYIPLTTTLENFESFVRSLAKSNFRGGNVTVPFKEIAYKIADDRDKLAEATGAANTLEFRNGKIIASNTDGFGFFQTLKIHNIKKADKIVIAGAGGAARAILAKFLVQTIYRKAKFGEITILNRTQERADDLKKEFLKKFPEMKKENLKTKHWTSRNTAMNGADLFINTTTLGMKNQDKIDIDLSGMKTNGSVIDIVYNPLETRLLKQAKKLGLNAIGGLDMLIYQALPGFDIWFSELVKQEEILKLKKYLIQCLQKQSV